MSKLDILAEGREQGILFAHKIIKTAQAEGRDPVKALEDELAFRKRIKLDTLLTKKELEQACENYKVNMFDSITALALVTLWDEFGFGGRKRLPEFADAFRRNTDAFFEGYLTWEDVIKTLDEKCDMKIELSDDLEARR